MLLLPAFATGQDAAELKRQGLKHYEQGRYYLAASYLEESRKFGGNDDTLSYFIAEANRHFHNCTVALNNYRSVAESQNPAFPEAMFYMGLMHKCLGEYEKASEWFLRYSLSNDESISEARVNQEIKACAIAPEIIRDTLSVKIEQPGEHINSPYTDFGAVQLKNNNIYFSSLRPNVSSSAQGLIPKEFQTNIYRSAISSAGYMRAGIWDEKVNHKREHTANISFSENGQKMYFTRCEREDGKMVCEIYRMEKKGNQWSRPRKLPELINQKDHSTTHPFISVTAGQEVLYFSSDRDGGQGGMDIWYSVIQQDEFMPPVNLGPIINTPADEITPFYYQQDSTLYFSSEWHAGLGGYDIFRSKGGFASWTNPENVGYPLNTSANDLYFTINPDGFSGYITSNRPGSYFITSQNCCNDIFYYEHLKKDEKDSIAERKPDTLDVVLQQARKLLPVTLYFDNDIPRPAKDDDTTNARIDLLLKEYATRKQVYLDNYIRNDVGTTNSDREKMEAFFRQIDQGGELLDSLMNYLYAGLASGEDIHLILKGYASPLTSAEYNLKLSKRRIVSLVNYLKVADSGKLKPFMNGADTSRAQLFIYQEAMGEVSAETVSDNPADKRNSVYSLAAARARKIVITDVRRNADFISEKVDIGALKVQPANISYDSVQYPQKHTYSMSLINNSALDVVIDKVVADRLLLSWYFPGYEVEAGSSIRFYLQVNTEAVRKKEGETVKIFLKGAEAPLIINVSASEEKQP